MLLPLSALVQSALAADFSGANLNGARLTNVDLRGSDLSGADLTDANLSGSDLTGTNVTQQQLDSACGSGTRLPPGLRIQPCLVTTADAGDADGGGQRASADRALDQARSDRATSSGVLVEAPALGMQTQDSQRPSQAHRDLSISGTETSSKAARQ